MSFVDVLLIGVGLSMDAAAVSAVSGMSIRGLRGRESLAIALAFGLFQGLMPLLGAVSAYFATRHGVNNYLAWLAPPLCAYLAHYIVTTYAPSDAGPTLLTAFLSIIGAAAGHVRNEQTK